LSLIGVCLFFVTTVCCRQTAHSTNTAQISDHEWHEFKGTWTATGSRNSIRLADDRIASISTFTGSLVLTGTSRPGVAFRSEGLIFNDSATGLVGRAVWTDEKGDHAFSELRGNGTSRLDKIVGTFVGGTGRYSGAVGTYEFKWLFMVENEDGVVQGQSVDLNGKVSVASDQPQIQRGSGS
jgi:hypothetical protein